MACRLAAIAGGDAVLNPMGLLASMPERSYRQWERNFEFEPPLTHVVAQMLARVALAVYEAGGAKNLREQDFYPAWLRLQLFGTIDEDDENDEDESE
jgi:hypothetical protein